MCVTPDLQSGVMKYPQTANVGAYRISPDAQTYPRERFRAYAIRPYRQFGKMRTFISSYNESI